MSRIETFLPNGSGNVFITGEVHVLHISQWFFTLHKFEVVANPLEMQDFLEYANVVLHDLIFVGKFIKLGFRLQEELVIHGLFMQIKFQILEFITTWMEIEYSMAIRSLRLLCLPQGNALHDHLKTCNTQ
jgi:hypothetical protein